MVTSIDITITAMLLFCTALCVDAWWDGHCAEGGQCAAMISSYENLITGEGCRSFYVTGKCSRICTYSLKSLIGRHTWAKCAQRCDWSTAVIAGASSWLDMCLDHPAKDVFHSEEADHPAGRDMLHANKLHNNNGQKATSMQGNVNKRSSLILYVMAAIGMVIVLSVMLMNKLSPNGSLHTICDYFTSWLRRLQRKQFYGAKTTAGKGPLDVGPDRTELRNLQRGARRHLKALRANQD